MGVQKMGKMLSNAGFWNNPLALGLIVGGIVVIAVAVILYFLVFKTKIAACVEKQKANKAANNERYEKSSNLAADIFQEKKSDEQRVQEEKDSKANIEEIERLVNANKNYAAKDLDLSESGVRVTKPKKEPKPFDPFNSGQSDKFKGGQ